MTLEELLKEDNARVELRGRWLSWWDDEWVVQDHEYHARSNKVLYRGDYLDEAVRILKG